MTLKALQAYGKEFQFKVLGALLTDKKFILEIRDVLRSDHFDSDAHKWIVDQVIKYFDEFHTNITLNVLKVELKKVENEILQISLKEELKNSYKASQEDLEYVKKEFSAFCRNQEMKQAILTSADLLKNANYDGIRSIIEKAMKAGTDKNIGHEYKKDVETRYREDYRPTIPSPWAPLNRNLQGGFGPGDLGVIFGSPGAGKTWVLIAIAAHAVKMGYNVNFYTLELGEDYVGKRFDCYYTGKSIEEISDYREDVNRIVKELKGNLVVKEYAPKTASINTIKANIQRCTDLGFPPDIVMIDYVDYLKSPGKTRFSERKDEVDDVYIATKGLAKELKIPILTPSQVNRLGAKDSVIEGDKAAGSYDKMMVADMAFSLSRQKEDKVLGTGRWHFMKNRYGKDGITFNIEIDTGNGHLTFKDESETEDSSDPFDTKKRYPLAQETLYKLFGEKD